MHAIALLVRSLDDVDKVRPVLLHLGGRHVSYGVEDQHFTAVGEALIWTLGQGLGELFGDAEREAWVILYDYVSETMREGAAAARLARSA